MEFVKTTQITVDVEKHGKNNFLVFVNGAYKGMLQKFPNTKTETFPYTALVAVNGPGKPHEVGGHFFTADGGKDAAIMAIVNA